MNVSYHTLFVLVEFNTYFITYFTDFQFFNFNIEYKLIAQESSQDKIFVIDVPAYF